ncbi:hypothetical protein C1I95_01535 [Micromonospora craterilacus]|uniref:Uncharacterized protein n=1 Tax=Micromonospora craterilacus TaxID=1655439 RepID=A0A2W2ENR7_9ACTN|nr:hypothetical protein C1I95_01535 [Micromonospora craterilacus]
MSGDVMFAEIGRVVGTLVLAYIGFHASVLILTLVFGRSPELLLPPMGVAAFIVWWFLLRRSARP